MRDYSMPAGGRGFRAGGSGVDVSPESSEVSSKVQTVVPSSEAEQRMARLVRAIEGEIVPRLVLVRRVTRTSRVIEGRIRAPDDTDVAELVRLLLAHDVQVAAGYVASLRQQGASLEGVCLKLLAPAARELGLMWEKDECDFMQVTVGLCRLHQVLRDISAEWRADDLSAGVDKTILLAPVPGEQHTFGIMLVAHFLRQAGWEVWHEFPETPAQLLEAVRRSWFAVVGLSVGCDSRLEEVANLIKDVRTVSHNRAIGVLVGGPVLVANPEVARLIGADGTAADGQCAVSQAERLCSAQAAIH